MKLSNEQQKAVTHHTGPCLVLAVPGAGKTTVLLNRTVNLVKEYGVNPQKILSITFSKAQAMDMERRFRNKKSIPAKFSTIHALCFQVLREYGIKHRKNYCLIEDASLKENKYRILSNLYREFNNDYVSEEKLDDLLLEIGYIKNSMLDPNSHETQIDNFKEIFKGYEVYKRKRNLIDFDDMLTLTEEIFRTDEEILGKYRNKYEFIQLDEGQDTSKVQVEIIKKLAYPKNNLFVVADDDQSIYGFRGAYPEWLLNYKEAFPDAKVFFIEKNYRSAQNIVEVLNTFIEKNENRYKKTLITDIPATVPINVVKVKTPDKQYQYILEDLKKNPYKESAILYRNNLSSIGLVDYFSYHDVKFFLRDTRLKFFNHRILRDIFAFLRFSRNPKDINSFDEIFYKMKGYISRKQVEYAKTNQTSADVLDRILSMPYLKDFYIDIFNELKFDFRRLQKLKPIDAIEFIEYELGYNNFIRENIVKYGSTKNSLNSILYYLKEIAKKTSSLDEFALRLKELNELVLQREFSPLMLSTIHSAKGMEFDNVYIIDLNEGTFPTMRDDDNQLKTLEEERRLFYVGLSRAKTKLTLLYPTCMGEDGLKASRFIGEIVK
ncbi:MAG: ATP-dependent helicase [Tissierellia bacterium]|nr:ATP-dependent helicase [Tissierellia bacterium]